MIPLYVDTHPLHKDDVCQLMIDWNQFSGSCKVDDVTDGQLVTNFNFASRQLFNFQKQPLETRFSKQEMNVKGAENELKEHFVVKLEAHPGTTTR